MFRRSVALGLFCLLAMLSASPWVACAGWQTTAADRHACCARLAHACPESGDADSCCARKESASHSNQAAQAQADGTVAIVPAAFTALFHARLAADARTLAIPTGTLAAHDQSSLYLRHSLLRV